MQNDDVKEAPMVGGWAIAAGVGVVAAGVTHVAMGFGLNQAVFVGIVLFLVVGVILGLPRKALPAPGTVSVAAPAFAPAAPLQAAPAAAFVAAPAMAAPLMPAAPPVAHGAEPSAPVMAMPARRPAALAAARDSGPDDLKMIKGVGPVLEKLLHSLGYFHFDQIAGWTAEEVAWVDDNLEGFKGRVTRDDWVPQAKILAAGGTTEFSRRVEDGEVY